MKICIIADQIYKSGGIERVLSLRINYWLEAGHEVHLVTSENNNELPYFIYDTRLTHHDIPGNFNKSISLFAPKNLVLAGLYFTKLRKTINAINPDVILMTNYHYDYYLLPVIAKNCYCIKEYHSSFIQNTDLRGKLIKYLTKFYDTHVFLSPEEVKLANIANSIVIPNPVSKPHTHPDPLEKRQKVIIAAGRVFSIKGFDRLIDIWSKIALKYPDWRLEIYGDGEPDYIKYLSSIINEKHIESNTFIFPSDPNIIEKMLDSRIYAMTSLSECFPMVLLEAMQSSMAIIAFDCPTGPRNMIKNGETGLLIENNKLNEFAASLEQLIKDDELSQALADNAYKSSQIYSIENIMKKWDAELQKAVSNS